MPDARPAQDYQALLEAYLRQLGLEAFLQSYQSYS